ncbi:MAG: MBL fold metallo-hydrolase [Bacteroidales bacterium]|nr:MBL fold metallo-hydrolase [Bacteroidales bacterium]
MKIKQFEFNPFPVNCYLVFDDTKQAALIDAGMWTEKEEEELARYIEQHDLTLSCLLNTHMHFDHCMDNAFIFQKYGLRTTAHTRDEFFVQNIALQAAQFNIKLRRDPQEIGSYINEGDEIHFGNTTLKALHVPGHSPGSIVYYCEKEAVIFSGDVIFKGSVGRADLPGGDFHTLIKGIKEKLLPLPDETVIYPGHGPKTTIGEEKRYNMYLI